MRPVPVDRLARMMAVVIFGQRTRQVILRVVEKRRDAQKGAVRKVLADAALGVPEVKAGIVAVAVRSVVPQIREVADALVLKTAARSGLNADPSPAPAVDLAVGLLFVVARIGDDVDHTGGRAVAVANSLWTVENLQLAHAPERNARVVRRVEVEAAQVFAVHREQDAPESRLAVAAHLDLREGRIARPEVIDVEARNARRQLRQILRVRRLNRRSVEDLDMLRHLHRLLADARGLHHHGGKISGDRRNDRHHEQHHIQPF